MVKGVIASQIGYAITPLQKEIIASARVAALDMEAASISQVLNQCKVNLIAIKVVSNGVYPGDPGRMEAEYHDNRDEVSRTATATLRKVLDFLDGKTIEDLGSNLQDQRLRASSESESQSPTLRPSDNPQFFVPGSGRKQTDPKPMRLP